jgi:N-acetylneuraminic acid mutarotase
VIGSTIYVAGGENLSGVSDHFYCLDLHKSHLQWRELPRLPHQVSNTVMVVQSNGKSKCIYLIGGRKKNSNGISELYRRVFSYDPLTQVWTEKKSLPTTLAAGTGIPAGKHSILLLGGDKGEVFHRTEELNAAITLEKDEQKKRVLSDQKAGLQSSHPGFSHEILQYDTKSDNWFVNSTTEMNIPVTTNAIRKGTMMIIPGGEIRAGVRSAWILDGKIDMQIP